MPTPDSELRGWNEARPNSSPSGITTQGVESCNRLIRDVEGWLEGREVLLPRAVDPSEQEE